MNREFSIGCSEKMSSIIVAIQAITRTRSLRLICTVIKKERKQKGATYGEVVKHKVFVATSNRNFCKGHDVQAFGRDP